VQGAQRRAITSPARSNMPRCFITPNRVIGMPSHNCEVVLAPSARRSISARRVGSASACQMSGADSDRVSIAYM
jgi:hypothetical protein